MDYFDMNINLSEVDLALREASHKFAKQVMRPISRELDEMKPEAVVASGSPLWDFLKKAYELGYHTILLPESVGGMGLSPLQQCIVLEELGWGSFGMAIQLAIGSFVALGSIFSNDDELIEKFALPYVNCRDGSIRACWGGTEPDHGSDCLAVGEAIYSSPEIKAQCTAKRDGDEWVINGQKAAWVSGGTISTHCWLHVQVDPTQGFAGSGCAIVPMDLPGVSKGKPLNKMGQRDLNQGELFFDDVRIPAQYMVIDPDFYTPILEMFLTTGNLCVGVIASGAARAAFDESFRYCNERVQGGKLLKEHYSIKQRIFTMFQRVELCRALTRRVAGLNLNISPGLGEYSILAKTTATQLAFENAHDAIQIFGGNGLTKEYLPEKLFRDTRSGLIEDGSNEVLMRQGGYTLFETYPRSLSSI